MKTTHERRYEKDDVREMIHGMESQSTGIRKKVGLVKQNDALVVSLSRRHASRGHGWVIVVWSPLV
jgi:hypothetical protein